jgi:hypothetical protein
VKLKKVVFYRIHPRYARKAAGQELQSEIESLRDMFRYDLAFHHPDDLTLVAFPVLFEKGYGSCGGEVTAARWDSFGVTLSPISGVPQLWVDKTAEWRTYRHPRTEHRVIDYSRLEPIALAEFLKDKARLSDL